MLTWLDQRTGAITQMRDFLTEDVPGGASYWYTFGSATLFAMILQIVTGIFLCFYYAPSTATACRPNSCPTVLRSAMVFAPLRARAHARARRVRCRWPKAR